MSEIINNIPIEELLRAYNITQKSKESQRKYYLNHKEQCHKYISNYLANKYKNDSEFRENKIKQVQERYNKIRSDPELYKIQQEKDRERYLRRKQKKEQQE